MRILFATESYYPNIDGGAIAQHRLVQELVRKGHEVGIVTPGTSLRNTTEDDNGSTIFRTRAVKLPLYMGGKYFFSPFPIFKIKHILKSYQPDVVDVCSPYHVGVSTLICAKRQKIPVVSSIHTLPENMFSPFLHSKYFYYMKKFAWFYLIFFFNLADWVTIPTQTGAEMYKKKGLNASITPISNGIDTKTFHPNNNGEYLRKKYKIPKKKIILFSGRMTSEKNVDVLIKAIPHVIKNIDAHFVFCGSGRNYKQQMINLASSLNILNYTTFIDFLDWEDYPNIYTVADLFVMPAEAELQSIVTMEAIASGLPAVVVKKGAVHELVNNDNGLVFDPQDSQQLAKHIVTILSDPSLRRTMSKKSLELAKMHTMEYVSAQYEKVYGKLCSQFSK